MKANDTVFCIPSYKRFERQDTLSLLLSLGVDISDIYLFVQTEEDRELYMRYVGNCNLIYAAADSLPKTRNNILNAISKEKNVVMLDDDISAIQTGAKGRKLQTINSQEQFFEVINRMYDLTKALGGKMWGFYPICDSFFMSDTLDTKKPVNTILGFPKGFDLRFDEKFIAKEDIELCGRILGSGGSIIRCNNIGFKAKHRTNKGGANDIWKSGVNKKFASLLNFMSPDV